METVIIVLVIVAVFVFVVLLRTIQVIPQAQAAIVEVLVAKTIRAARRLGMRCVTASGGVACNSALRRELAAACTRAGLKLRLAERLFSTDNAAMIGILAERKLLAGAQEMDLDAEIEPSWALPLNEPLRTTANL